MVKLQLTEGGISITINAYSVALGEVVGETTNFTEKLTRLAKKANYPPLTSFSNEIISFLNEDLPPFILKEFENTWNAEAGGHTLMKRMDHSKSFDQSGVEKLKNRARDTLTEKMKKTYPFIPETTENLSVETKTFEQVQNALTSYQRTLERFLDQAEKFGRREDSISYTLVQPSLYIVIATMLDQLQQYFKYNTATGEQFKAMMLQQIDSVKTVNAKAKSTVKKLAKPIDTTLFLD